MSLGEPIRLSNEPILLDNKVDILESDFSSRFAISDRRLPSSVEDVEAGPLSNKYDSPDQGKTKLALRTNGPLSPLPRSNAQSSPTQRPVTPTPATPQSARPLSTFQSPIWPGYSSANDSRDCIDEGTPGRPILSRSSSAYSLGRESLQSQLAHLTSIKLPNSTSLARKLSAFRTAPEAVKALSEAAEQINIWISKASDVLKGLSAEDDIEWAAAGGTQGIEEVDAAIDRFRSLVDVYIDAVEGLQRRENIASLLPSDLQSCTQQMDAIVTSWQKVRDVLKGTKEQVEIGLEWQRLSHVVLGQVEQELAAMNRLIFEMEEKRHQGAESLLSSNDSIDFHELETLMEGRPEQGPPSHRHSLGITVLSDPTESSETIPSPGLRDNTSLLALFARMQPLRASLDFMPMQISTFTLRGKALFPTACRELLQRQDNFETQYKNLEADAESLRRELSEDRWILVFRNAGRQALKMEESITRSYNKLKEALDLKEHQINAPSFARKAENFEAKKVHYGPAIERVLAIIDRGVQDRLTVNGEILRLQRDMKSRWSFLQARMADLVVAIAELTCDGRGTPSRESLSTIISSERSLASSMVDTPGSSPASSVVGDYSSQVYNVPDSRTPTPLTYGKTRKNILRPASSIPNRLSLAPRDEWRNSRSPSSLAGRSVSSTLASSQTLTPQSYRPRWQIATKAEPRDFLPLSALEPSPYAKSPVVRHTTYLRSSSQPLNHKASMPHFPTSTLGFRTDSRLSTEPRTPSTLLRNLTAVDLTSPTTTITTERSTSRMSSLPIPVPNLGSKISVPGSRASSLMLQKTKASPRRYIGSGSSPASGSLVQSVAGAEADGMKMGGDGDGDRDGADSTSVS